MLFFVLISLYIPWDTSHWTVPNGIYANGDTPRKNDRVCAHRTLPFGTKIYFINFKNMKRSHCIVKDRGPYGACIQNKGSKDRRCSLGYRYIVDTTSLTGNHYRAEFDATPRVHKDLRTKGITRVLAVIDDGCTEKSVAFRPKKRCKKLSANNWRVEDRIIKAIAAGKVRPTGHSLGKW
ncbi:MAG: hypothetical protein V3U84_02370 [Thiotrichaceae bacterium]